MEPVDRSFGTGVGGVVAVALASGDAVGPAHGGARQPVGPIANAAIALRLPISAPPGPCRSVYVVTATVTVAGPEPRFE